MANTTTSSSSSSALRFLGLIKQPESDPRVPDPVELHESDVVWSFSSAAAPPPRHHFPRFNSARSGLSAALSDDHHHLIRRKPSVDHQIIPPATRQDDAAARFPQSAPMNIPAWPKGKNGDPIMVDEAEEEEEDDDEGEEEMVPPHVIVARSHVTFSVFEGAGRTLKGRDLRRVRNAVFQKTGFID